MSKKYIIEIEDEPLVRHSALHGETAVYKAVGFNSLVFDQNGLDKLTPYNESSAENEVGDVYVDNNNRVYCLLDIDANNESGWCINEDGCIEYRNIKYLYKNKDKYWSAYLSGCVDMIISGLRKVSIK